MLYCGSQRSLGRYSLRAPLGCNFLVTDLIFSKDGAQAEGGTASLMAFTCNFAHFVWHAALL